jgi:hypothetical protein
MLVTTQQYNKDTIVSFKLVNGDEIVAKFVEERSDRFIISKPTTVLPSQQGIGLVQSLFTSDLKQQIELQKSHVMLHAATIKEMENHYIQTTTGIQPVGAGGILV